MNSPDELLNPQPLPRGGTSGDLHTNKAPVPGNRGRKEMGPMSSTIQPRSRARRHMRPVTILLAALALPAALLASCSLGGSTFPGAYQCTAPQHPVGCATAITFTHSHINPDSNPDIAGNPLGLDSQILLVPLTCDAACQASSGGGNPPGFISNYVELWQASGGGYFLRIGYTTTPSRMQYFLEY